jgi:ABC-type multidrug transport system ATPase subunit
MGKTVVVSSHLLSEIEQMATQVLIIDRGKKKVEGKSVDLFDPAQTIVKVEVNDYTSAIKKMSGSNWATHLTTDGSHSILFSLHRDQLPQLYKDLAALDISVISFQPRHSLEDYFLKITSGKPHVQAYTN